jgi:flagellar basal-body rod protein FlgC
MVDALRASIRIAGSALDAQSMRLRVVSENLANVRSAGESPGADPFMRKTVTFGSELDRVAGVQLVKVRTIGVDPAPFRVEHDPGHPAADASGNVRYPNVDPLVELADAREANRAYEANVQVVKQARSMVAMMIDLMRGQG